MKIKRLIATILLIAMALSTGLVFAEEVNTEVTRGPGYDEGYRDGRDFVRDEYRAGATLEDLPAEPDELPDYDFIRSRHGRTIDRLTQRDQGPFFENYDIGYVAGYKEERAYLFNIDEDEETPEVTVSYADSLGTSMGEIAGFNDFYNGSRSNWSRAIPSNREITSLFDLSRETSEYRSVFLAEFRSAFETAYNEAFEFALLEGKDVILNSAVENGKAMGLALGSLYGNRDYFEGRSNNYKRNLPSDSSITSDYQLNRHMGEYKTGFLNGFKLGYEEGYNEAYYNSYKEALDSGKTAGESKGQMMATKDYIENKDMDWTRHKSLSSAISTEYRLIYLSNSYRGSFLNGFWLGFAESYEATYKELIGGQVSEKIAFDIMTIAGGTLAGPDGSIILNIDPGTFYNDTAVSIERVFNEKYSFDQTRYIKASHIYNIEISNPSKNLNNSKPISIAMEYYGDESGGIYKWVDGKWTYLSSLAEEGGIMAQINPNTIRPGDNIYTILLDRNHDLLTDVRAHWAKEEINVMVRRNIITGYPDETFRPERNISRAEFLTLLSRAYNWTLPRTTTNIDVFKDYSSFNYYDKVISYGISHGLIIGYPDETFRPDNPISYKEIELIMGRLLYDPNFRWYNTSARMLYDKQIKSNSYNSMNNKITRAEVSYMLYILNEWRY